MTDFIINLLPKLEHIGLWGYWIVLFASLFESFAFVGVFFPGTLIVVFAGFLSARGNFDIGDLIWFAAIGAVLGDSLSFYLGSKGIHFFKKENKLFSLKNLEKGEKFFKKHGDKSVFLGRFIGFFRAMIPFIAGLSRMNKKVFYFWNILSAFLWAISYLLLGYFFGQAWQTIAVWSSRAGIFLFIIFLLLLVIYFLKKLIIKKGKRFFKILKSLAISIKEAIIKNQEVVKFTSQHKIFISFLTRRVNKNKFTGLPLTLLGLVFIYIFSLFVGIIQNIVFLKPIVTVDIRIANLLSIFYSEKLIKVFSWITYLGNWQIVFSLSILVILLFLLWKRRIYLWPFLFIIVGSEIFVYLGKLIFGRSRPEIAYYDLISSSFPSGHATFAVVFFGFLTYFFWRELKEWKYKINILFSTIIIIMAIGFSRLYLGLHFISDVWGGYLLGLLWLVVGISLTEWLLRKNNRVESVRPDNKYKIIAISILLIICQVIFYIGYAINYQPAMKEIALREQTIIAKDTLTIFQEYNLSKYTETLTGLNQEPISFIIIAPDNEKFISAFQDAGWFLADKLSFTSVYKISKALARGQGYATAPMTPSFWNQATHDFGFEKPTDVNSVKRRHHARFWQTNFKTAAGDKIYLGTASLDIGIKWGIVHKIEPDIDTEREFLFNDLNIANQVENWQKPEFVTPVLGKNFAGDQFFTDGQVYIIYLK
ncbi:MAG: LssY C-terminal domain-containing protein [Patescibacteria group bacterium]